MLPEFLPLQVLFSNLRTRVECDEYNVLAGSTTIPSHSRPIKHDYPNKSLGKLILPFQFGAKFAG